MTQLPPRFIDGERAILGACLLNNAIINDVSDFLTEADFYNEHNRCLFSAIYALRCRNVPVDWVSLTDELKKLGRLDDIGGAAYLVGLADAVPSAANWRHYAQKIKDCAALRQTIAATQEIQTMCYQRDADPKAIADIFWNRANSGLRDTETGDLIQEDMIIQSFIKTLEDGSGTPFRTGLLNWDNLTGGLYPGHLVVIGGRPSMGKSSLLLSLFSHLRNTTDFGLALFSLEMTQAQVAARRLSEASRVPIHIIRGNRLGNQEWASVIEKSAEFYESKVFISDQTGITCSQIERKILKAERAHGIKFGVIGIDFMQIMGSDTKERDEVKRLDSIAYGLLALAKKLDCCVIALSQLGNTIDQKPAFTIDKGEVKHGRRPSLVDIRGSGFIVAAARQVIALYRPAAYEDEMLPSMNKEQYRGVAEAIVRKNNDGPCGTIHLTWNPETATFRDRLPDSSSQHYMEAM